MSDPSGPFHVAIVGSGPSAFFAAGYLFARREVEVHVDMFDRLPTPFGLVRGGVAPDHEDIKRVAAQYEKIGAHPRFRFFGNVELGRDLEVEDLRRHYHQIIYATGAETDRRMGIPGEDLQGSHSATEFVAWYNGRPDFRDRRFDLSARQVAVVGVGNVAVDVCRILGRTHEELRVTDIADHALEALRHSGVRELYMLGRRGPAQAAFTNAELKELGEMPDTDVVVSPEDAELDELSRKELEDHPDKMTRKKVELIQQFAQARPLSKPRRLTLRFFVSPVEVLGEGGRVTGLRLRRNQFVRGKDGGMELVPTDRTEVLPTQLLFRSIGYKGLPLPGLPFDDRRGVIPNDRGRVLDGQTPRTGEYVVGWIKRGPTGVIGTNKPDALETVELMLQDRTAGAHLRPESGPEAIEDLLQARSAVPVSWRDWRRIDELETEAGRAQGRPRVKMTRTEDMLAALRRQG